VDRVRSRFAHYLPPPTPPLQPGGRAAAVLLPVFEEDGEARLVLTRRPETMPSHRGEIAFPGGKVEPSVDVGARDAALREAEEEIGLRHELVEVVSELPTLGTVVGQFNITPFVGVTDGRPVLTDDSREVDRVFDVTLAELLADGVYHEERWSWGLDGTERAMQFYELEDETIWGATARILTGFLARIVDVEMTGDWGDWTRA
jgi:8-oxo-dGTP pyrophosphatase MutT (NUDIX family)